MFLGSITCSEAVSEPAGNTDEVSAKRGRCFVVGNCRPDAFRMLFIIGAIEAVLPSQLNPKKTEKDVRGRPC